MIMYYFCNLIKNITLKRSATSLPGLWVCPAGGLSLRTLPRDWEGPGNLAWDADEDMMGQLPTGILCTALCRPPGMGSKDQTEMEGGTEAQAGGVIGST